MACQFSLMSDNDINGPIIHVGIGYRIDQCLV
jgi:hypothetical protein